MHSAVTLSAPSVAIFLRLQLLFSDTNANHSDLLGPKSALSPQKALRFFGKHFPCDRKSLASAILFQKTREGCGCFQGLFGGSKEHSGKVPGKLLEKLSESRNATNSGISGTKKGKPARNLGPALWTFSPPSVRGVCWNRQFQPSRVFLTFCDFSRKFKKASPPRFWLATGLFATENRGDLRLRSLVLSAVTWFGRHFHWNDSGFGPKVRGTVQESELQPESESYSPMEPPQIWTESPQTDVWIGIW